jgi:hypothetical protein
MRGFEIAMNIDDKSHKLYWGYSYGKGWILAIQATGYGC